LFHFANKIRIFLLVLLVLTSCTNKPKLNAVSCDEPGTIGSNRTTNPTQGFEIAFQYYLPPCYDIPPSAQFPVIYLITVPFESVLNPNENFPMSLADRLIHADKMPPTILIVPSDIIEQGYHAALAIDLVPYVDAQYRTIQNPRYRGIGGISHGGGIAARAALQFPDVFGSAGILSGGIASNEIVIADEWLASVPTRNLPRFRIDVGEQDSGILPYVHNLTEVLDHNEVPYTINIEPGGHNWGFWSPRMESYLLWFAEGWE